MGHQNMVPRDDPYDINSPLICRQATRVTKVYTERMLQAGTVSVGLLLVWIRSFSAFCKTLIPSPLEWVIGYFLGDCSEDY